MQVYGSCIFGSSASTAHKLFVRSAEDQLFSNLLLNITMHLKLDSSPSLRFHLSSSSSLKTNQHESSSLPLSTGGFANNHVMVNLTRKHRNLPPLCRSRRLDDLAKAHVQQMANRQAVQHSVSTLEELQAKVGSTMAGENVQRALRSADDGNPIRHMHFEGMKSPAICGNVTDPDFTAMGMATAQGSDGYLYMCQVFC